MLRADKYIEVLRHSFRDSRILSRFFWRDTDNRARVLLSHKDDQGRVLHHSIPLTALKAVRNAARLQVNRLDPVDRRYTVWANLNFGFYEQQVLFFCAFIALKRQDAEHSSRHLDDYFPGEDMVFSGQVEDDHYLHALRMYRDMDTDAVRLEASARRGAMVRSLWSQYPLCCANSDLCGLRLVHQSGLPLSQSGLVRDDGFTAFTLTLSSSRPYGRSCSVTHTFPRKFREDSA